MQDIIVIMYITFTLALGEGAETEVKMRTTGFKSMEQCEEALDQSLGAVGLSEQVVSFAGICVDEVGA